jgi:hypothetical protein
MLIQADRFRSKNQKIFIRWPKLCFALPLKPLQDLSKDLVRSAPVLPLTFRFCLAAQKPLRQAYAAVK